ncbi:MAG TPA: hypothetical protein VG148_07900 [Pyrinomonadaceae bacterium]|nr:hypothetical protein [Pyrinomonadaceae bacterium]
MGMRTVVRYLRRAVSVGLIAAALGGPPARPAAAQVDKWGFWENGVSEAWWLSAKDFTEEDGAGVVARWNAAGRAGASANAWAGDYFRGGSTHGTYVRWSPEGGFVIAHVNKCAAQAVGVVYGRAEFTPSLVRFVPEFSRGASRPHAHGDQHHAPPPAELRFVPVEWGGQRLLVPEDEMDDFGDFLAGLGRYNDWGVFLFLGYTEFLTQFSGPEGGDGGGGPAVSASRPKVPAGYERFLKRPVEGAIIAVGRSRVVRDYSEGVPNGRVMYGRARLTPVTVNVGTDHGAADGMMLRVSEPAEGDGVRIVRAGKRTSKGVVARSLDKDGRATFYDYQSGQERPHSPVKAGWSLTTSMF